MTYVEHITDSMRCAYPHPKTHAVDAILSIDKFSTTATGERREIYLPFCIACNNLLSKIIRPLASADTGLRICKYPKPEIHNIEAALPIDQFQIIKLQHPPTEYVTDNCLHCLDIAKRSFINRGYRLLDQADPELIRLQHLQVQKVESVVVYLRQPPRRQRIRENDGLTPEERRANQEEYTQLVAQFPKRERRRSSNNEEVKANNRRRHHAIRSGLWVQMYKAQNDCCASCKDKFTRVPHLDHDHNTDFVRGLLCGECNLALGFARDSIERLLQLVEYLKKSADTFKSAKQA